MNPLKKTNDLSVYIIERNNWGDTNGYKRFAKKSLQRLYESCRG